METGESVEFAATKQRTQTTLSELAKNHGWEFDTHPRLPSVTKMVLSNACERKIDFDLKNPEDDDRRFDSIYREKSEYATIKILDFLKTRLDELGMNASITTEVRDKVGVYDVTIVKGNPCEVLRGKEKIVRLEIKASLGLPLEQLERYLWNPTPLVLIRVVPGHVTLLRPSELTEFILFSLGCNQAKAERLLKANIFTVPGNYCTYCRDLKCSFNKKRGRGDTTLVRMDDSEFGTDLRSFLANLPYVAEKTATLVVQELSRGVEGDGSVRDVD